MCVCGSSGGRKGMNSPQTLATQTEAFRAALISVQPVREKYKRHCFEGCSKPTLKCGWTPPNMKNPISVPLLNIPSCNDDDLSAADKPHHCKHKAFFFFFIGFRRYKRNTPLGSFRRKKHTFSSCLPGALNESKRKSACGLYTQSQS